MLEVKVGVDNAPDDVVLPAVAAVVLPVAAEEKVEDVVHAVAVLTVPPDEEVDVADVPVGDEPAPVEEELDAVFIFACSSRCSC